MTIIRIIIGLLLVILPASQSRSKVLAANQSEGILQSQVAKSDVKENLYHDFALIETQEKANVFADDDSDDQNFTGLLHPFFEYLHLLPFRTARERSAFSGYSLPVLVFYPRYILYHCLIIPF